MNKQPLKIAFVIDALRVGGAERMLLDLAKSLPKNEFSCRVYTIVEQGELAAEFTRAGIPVINIGKTGKISWRTVTRLRQAWAEWKPDVVHTHLFAGDTYGRLSAWRCGIPVITTEHNMNLDEAGLKRWIRLVLSWCTRQIVAVSQAVKNYSVEKEHISARKISVIYNGVDPDRFSPVHPAPTHPIPVIGMTSRLHPNKGHEFFLRALAKLPQGTFRARIVGDGPLRKHLELLAKDLGISQHVEFVGLVSDVQRELEQMDLVVLPTLQEGFGLSVVEAMLMEKPVIAFETGPMREVIEHGKTGWLVPARDVDALSKIIQMVMSRAELRREVGQAARRVALERFSLTRMVGQYVALYRCVIEKV